MIGQGHFVTMADKPMRSQIQDKGMTFLNATDWSLEPPIKCKVDTTGAAVSHRITSANTALLQQFLQAHASRS
jgi:hypothetical protein